MYICENRAVSTDDRPTGEKMERDRVMTNPRDLVRIELKNAGFDIDAIEIPNRVYLLADDVYGAMLQRECGIYKYPLGGKLYVLKDNPRVGFVKGQMCSPAIATQAEDLIAGGVRELIHIGLAGGISSGVNIGGVVLTDGAYNDTAVAGLYGYNLEFLETSPRLTDELERKLSQNNIRTVRGKSWTTDAGYHETWGQILNYRSKAALCVEMEGAGLFAIARYRGCAAAALYIISDVITENGWSLGWGGHDIPRAISQILDMIINV